MCGLVGPRPFSNIFFWALQETTVLTGHGNHGGLGDAGSGEQSKPAAKNLLGWGNEIKVGDISIAIFGTGLRRCDSV